MVRTVDASLIQAFNKVSINNRIDPFFEDDIAIYFETPDEFTLDLKRSRSNLSLYGAEHVRIRQAFFNQLPIQNRRELFLEKINAVGITDWIEVCLQCSINEIQDVYDIGKARSIYKIIFKNKPSFVIKEKSNNNQFIFNEIAAAFKMPSPQSFYKEINKRFWELTEFLDDQEVFHSKKEDLIEIYAKAAAFGDFIGLGDRHFENYISRENSLVAIDVSHLMEKDNEHWTKKYIAGGLYEVCILQFYAKDQDVFKTIASRFFKAYYDHSNYCFEKKDNIDSFPLSDMIHSQWVSSNQFVQHMFSIYHQSLNNMIDRICYKQLLQQIVEQSDILDLYQELKMFYLADLDRISTFFRSEELSLDIFDQIKKLAADHLGVSQQYFVDYNQSVSVIKTSLEKQLSRPMTQS